MATGEARKPAPEVIEVHPVAFEVWVSIYDYLSTHRYPPSLREIAVAVGTSISNVKYHLDQLHARGFIARTDGARAIGLLKLPPGKAPIVIDGRAARVRKRA